MAAGYFDSIFQGDLTVYDAAGIDQCRAVSQRALMDDVVSVLDVQNLPVCTVRAKQDPASPWTLQKIVKMRLGSARLLQLSQRWYGIDS